MAVSVGVSTRPLRLLPHPLERTTTFESGVLMASCFIRRMGCSRRRIILGCLALMFSYPLLTMNAQTQELTGQAEIVGGHLVRDGKTWAPHGFHQIAFAVTGEALSSAPSIFRIAADHYSPQEYASMRDSGADSVRIQVAQNGIDPQGKYHTTEFQAKLVGAIRAARAANLTVIISLQNEKQTGETQQESELPSDATQRAWRVLAPLFAGDRGVMFEVFNEPRIRPMPPQGPSRDQWRAWADATESVIAAIRSTGARNVVIADGLQRAETLSGAPRLVDSLDQVVYASHPYAHGAEDQTPAAWDRKFGEFSRHAPVIISEWGIGYYCDLHTPKTTEQFIEYLQDRGIGMEIGTWDWSSATFGSYNYGFPDVQLSSFQNGVCHGRDIPAGFGVGKMVERWFKTGSPSPK